MFENDFCGKIFAWGFPSNESLNNLWDGQKTKDSPDNLVDHQDAMTSIRF